MTRERIVITRNCHKIAVLISPHDLAAVEETLEVMANSDLMRQLVQSRVAVEAGDVLDANELTELMARRAPTAPVADVEFETGQNTTHSGQS